METLHDGRPTPSDIAPPRTRGENETSMDHDCVIIGAGVGGLYQLYRLLRLGFDVVAVDANPDVGGTWFKNRYPGCRFDSESFTYGYSWSPEVLAEWNWSERFAAQPETLRYLRFVADKFQLRRHIRFNTKVLAARWDEDAMRWHLSLDSGRTMRTRFLVTAMGMLSVPTTPKIAGLGDFAGTALHTFDWPDDLDLTGKRVAVIGTGSTGVQVISTVAARTEQLTVLQLDASWCIPLHNSQISASEMNAIRSRYDETFKLCQESPSGFTHRPDRRKSTDVTREERVALWQKLYEEPGFGLWLGNFRDVLVDEAANHELSNFVAGKIRERVVDPEVAEILVPKDHGFGTKRVPLESGYYEVYNRSNVELIDLNTSPILRIIPEGVRIAHGDGTRDLQVEVIVFATGFDAVTGAFDRIDITGVDGMKLKEKWREGPETLLGVATHGFPNLLMIGGPQSGSVSANFPRAIEDVVNWASDFLADGRRRKIHRFEPKLDEELAWVEHVEEFHHALLMSRSKSWFNGHNVNLDRPPLKRPLVYSGGAVRYRDRLAREAAANYPSFEVSPGGTSAQRHDMEAT